MDEYGCFRNNAKDWAILAGMLIGAGSVTFCYCGDNYTAFVITITGPVNSIGTMSWGGNVEGLFAVGLRRRGFSYFDLHSERPITHTDSRIAELGLGQSDEIVMAELLDKIRINLREDMARCS